MSKSLQRSIAIDDEDASCNTESQLRSILASLIPMSNYELMNDDIAGNMVINFHKLNTFIRSLKEIELEKVKDTFTTLTKSLLHNLINLKILKERMGDENERKLCNEIIQCLSSLYFVYTENQLENSVFKEETSLVSKVKDCIGKYTDLLDVYASYFCHAVDLISKKCFKDNLKEHVKSFKNDKIWPDRIYILTKTIFEVEDNNKVLKDMTLNSEFYATFERLLKENNCEFIQNLFSFIAKEGKIGHSIVSSYNTPDDKEDVCSKFIEKITQMKPDEAEMYYISICEEIFNKNDTLRKLFKGLAANNN